MNAAKPKSKGWKQRLLHELIEYWITVAYMAFFFGIFVTYKRLILAQYQISYTNYGIGVIKALILAKVVMVGDVLRLGRGFGKKPLIVATLYRTAAFSRWVTLFTFAEASVRSLLKGKGWLPGIEEVLSRGKHELVAQFLVVVLCFIPFFAIKELSDLLGEGRLFGVFFRSRTAGASDLSRPAAETPGDQKVQA